MTAPSGAAAIAGDLAGANSTKAPRSSAAPTTAIAEKRVDIIFSPTSSLIELAVFAGSGRFP
jgi:hypothetical protein